MSFNEIKNEEKKLSNKSGYIICPECKENARILIKDYKIGLYDCKNGHKINNILINDFNETQIIDKTKTICQNCNKAQENNSENIFYICLNCNQILCKSCRLNHDENHNIIKDDKKCFVCQLHCESYTSYCFDCKKDIYAYLVK